MPSLSLAVMVRDDAARLKRCIDSLTSAVDEVVILDTGSKDDTVAVAKAAGARVAEMEWPGSFSVGLNALLAEVRTDWVLRLDSDEWFELDPKADLQDAIGKEENYGYKLVRRDILQAGGYREISIFRLWRADSRLRYEGLVHENISNEGIVEAFPDLRVVDLPLWFWHDGYAQGSAEKVRRNIALIESELEARPRQPYYRAMRAVMYRDLDDPRALGELEAVADDALLESEPTTRMLGSAFAALLQATPEDRIQEPRIGQVIFRSWKWFGNYPGVLWAIGVAESRRGRPEDALRAFMAIRSLVESDNYERSLPFDPNILSVHLWNALGFTASQLGRRDIAEWCAGRLRGG
jgi:hypothetical protein